VHTFRSPFDVDAFFFFFFFFSICVNNTTNNNRTPPPSANAFASGRDQNCGNVVTGRPTSRVLAPPGGTQTFTLGNDDDLNEENNALPSSSSSSESSSVVVVDPLALKRMPLSELRTLCRRHSLQPAGCKDALVERLEDWMMMMNNNTNTGVEISRDVFDATRAAPGTTRARENNNNNNNKNNNNNYARATSQNVGNFLTERPTSRVLAPPGGASSGIF
jgi:SPIRAL1-like protein